LATTKEEKEKEKGRGEKYFSVCVEASTVVGGAAGDTTAT
jgi:hypothetical protein